jgi:hypothetical protein
VVGQAVGPLVEVSIGEPTVAHDNGLAVRDRVGRDLEQVGEVEAGRRHSSRAGRFRAVWGRVVA